MEKTVVISDSHGEHIFSNNTMFDVKHIGPRTAFKLNVHNDMVMGALEGAKDRKILFIFGEIDCRRHIILKSIKNNITTDDLIYSTSFAYINYVSDLKSIGYDISIFNVVPPGEYTTGCCGSLYDRKVVTEKMNLCLNKMCGDSNLLFVDIYRYLINDSGFRRCELVSDEAHLNSKVVDIFMDKYRFFNM